MKLSRRVARAAIAFCVFFLLSPLFLFQNLFTRLVHKKNASANGWVQNLYAEVLSSLDEGLNTFFPDADEIRQEMQILTNEQIERIEKEADLTIDRLFERQYRFQAAVRKGKVLGYAVDDHVPGKWGSIHFLLQLSPSGEVVDVMVLEYSEKRGRPVAKERFLRQFFGKTVRDDIALMKDIRGVTGASISSRGMTNGIRKLVHVFHEFYGKGAV